MSAEIKTERLRLRPLEAADTDALHLLWTDPDVRRYLWGDQTVPKDRVGSSLTGSKEVSRLIHMELHLTPDLEARLEDLAAVTGRAKDELALDIMTSYLDDVIEVRAMLDRRYQELKSGSVTPVDGEEMLAHFREKSETFRNKRG